MVSHPRTPPHSRPSAPLSPARVLRPSGLHAGRLSGAASWTGTSPPASPPRGRARGAALWPLNSCPLPFVLLRRLHWQTRSPDRPSPKARGSLSPARPPPFASRLSRTPRGSPAGRPAPGALPAAVPRPRVPPHVVARRGPAPPPCARCRCPRLPRGVPLSRRFPAFTRLAPLFPQPMALRGPHRRWSPRPAICGPCRLPQASPLRGAAGPAGPGRAGRLRVRQSRRRLGLRRRVCRRPAVRPRSRSRGSGPVRRASWGRARSTVKDARFSASSFPGEAQDSRGGWGWAQEGGGRSAGAVAFGGLSPEVAGRGAGGE